MPWCWWLLILFLFSCKKLEGHPGGLASPSRRPWVGTFLFVQGGRLLPKPAHPVRSGGWRQACGGMDAITVIEDTSTKKGPG